MEFRAPRDVPQNLPRNYLPVALSALQSNATKRHVVVPLDPDAPLGSISQQQLRDLALEGFAPDTALGPFTTSEFFVDAGRTQAQKGGSIPKKLVLAVIDTGIAYWNTAFRTAPGTPDTCVFHEMGYMALNSAAAVPRYEVDFVDRASLLADCTWPQDEPHSRQTVRRIAAAHPECAFAKGLPADGFSHGTAMADRLISPLLAAGKTPKVVGLELPHSAFADSSGATLHALLPRALSAVNDMAQRAVGPKHQPWVICVLSYGATGAAFGANSALTLVLDERFSGELFVPTGNHLQDRLHAKLTPGETVSWHLPAFDLSANTIELVGTGALPDLVLEDPYKTRVHIPRSFGQLHLLYANAQVAAPVVGAVLAKKSETGWKMTIALPGTAPPEGLPAVSAGRWALSYEGKGDAGQIEAWIQRDEPVPWARNPGQRLQSFFEHPTYEIEGPNGAYPLHDAVPARTPIRRNGSVSAYAGLSRHPFVKTVGAQENQRGKPRTAYYSGQFTDPGQAPDMIELVDEDRQGSGTSCLGNGTQRRFDVSGTSVAAAKAAARAALAWEESYVPPSVPSVIK